MWNLERKCSCTFTWFLHRILFSYLSGKVNDHICTSIRAFPKSKDSLPLLCLDHFPPVFPSFFPSLLPFLSLPFSLVPFSAPSVPVSFPPALPSSSPCPYLPSLFPLCLSRSLHPLSPPFSMPLSHFPSINVSSPSTPYRSSPSPLSLPPPSPFLPFLLPIHFSISFLLLQTFFPFLYVSVTLSIFLSSPSP